MEEHLDELGKIYWHEAHHEALQLELHEYKDSLEFDDEFLLNKEALRMDTLIIKKNKDIQIDKNIGKIFRNHNIVEYKSETDSFSIWDYSKILGYAHIYSSFEQVPLTDITISISLTIYPRELIKTLEDERGYTIQDLGTGIYYVVGADFTIQILESKRMSESENLFLRNLRSNLSSEDMYKTLLSYRERTELNDKNVFISRLAQANPKAYLEAIDMFSEDLRELFLEGAERYGWLDNYVDKKTIRIVQKMFLDGESVEKIAKWTELSAETVTTLVGEFERTSVAH